MHSVTLVTIIIFTFTFVPLVVAEVARYKSIPSMDDFFLCGRNMSTLMCFFTVYATWYSSFAVVGSSAHFYLHGPLYMTAFAWNALFAVLFFILGRRMWFYGRVHNYMTPVDFFKDIFQYKPLSILVTLIIIVFTLPYIQIQFSGGAYLIEIASNGIISWELAGLVFYAIMVVYLWAGGLRAVAMTDIFFGILIFLSMIGAGMFLTKEAGGISAILDYFSNRPEDHIITDSNYIIWLTMFIVTPLGAIMSPPMWTRSYAVKSESAFYIIPFVIVLATASYLGSVFAGIAGKTLDPYLEDANTLVLQLIAQRATPVLVAFLFCGFAAASLSTANSQIHSLAGIYAKNVHVYLFSYRKNSESSSKISDAAMLRLSKWAVLFLSAIVYIFVICRPSIIITTGLIALGGTMQLIVPTIGALFWQKSSAEAATLGLLIGVSVMCTLSFIAHMSSSNCAAIGLILNAFCFITVSLAEHNSLADTNVSKRIAQYKEEFDKAHR